MESSKKIKTNNKQYSTKAGNTMRGRKTPYGCVAFVVIALTVGITILQEEKAKKERNGNKHAIESPTRMVSDSMTIGNMPHQTKEEIPTNKIQYPPKEMLEYAQYYQEGYEKGLEDGQTDCDDGDYQASYDNSNKYSGKKAAYYRDGYEDGYEESYEEVIDLIESGNSDIDEELAE